MAAYQHLELRFPEPGVALLTLNRPKVLNAVNTVLAGELRDVFKLAARGGREGMRVLVLTGAGERSFCVGGDLKERDGMSNEEWDAQRVVFREYNRAQEACPIPIISAVNGLALGGGLEMILRGDFAYGAEDARFGLPEIKWGFFPGSGGTQRLPRIAGEARAMEAILTGEQFGAEEALAWGVINKIFPRDDVVAAAVETAAKIAAHAPEAVRTVKHVVHLGLQTDLKRGLEIEAENHTRVTSLKDRAEGIRAFVEKREPKRKD